MDGRDGNGWMHGMEGWDAHGRTGQEVDGRVDGWNERDGWTWTDWMDAGGRDMTWADKTDEQDGCGQV